MRASTFRFTAADGAELHVYRWLPDDEPRAVLQIAHGLAEHAGRYEEVARYFTKEGYAVYADDHRGHGKTVSDEADLGFFRASGGWDTVVADLCALTRFLRKEHKGLPVFLLGHSMGSLLLQTYLYTFPDELDGALLCGTSGKVGFLATVGKGAIYVEKKRVGSKGRSNFLHQMSFGNYNRAFEPARTKMDWLSRDTHVVDAYLADPLCGFVATTSLWGDLLEGTQRNEDPRNQALIRRDLPLYVFTGEMCPVGQNLKSVRQLLGAYQRAGLTRVEHRFYEGARHEILNETNRQEVYDDVAGWLERTRHELRERAAP
ncbi:MAG: alpha/beta hydrolase [Myxococcota bacterium]